MEPALVGFVLAGGAVGLAIACYFTASFFLQDRSPALARFARACATEHGTCLNLLRSRYAHVFGLPNSVFGIGYYVALIAWSVDALIHGEARFATIIGSIAAFAGLFSVFLTWALLVRLRVNCVM